MNTTADTIRRWSITGWLLLAVAIVLPLIALSFYNHPSAADDYCFAYMTRDYGMWYSTKFYYDKWTGRYFASLLFHATPLWAGWLWYYQLLPVLYVLGTGWSFYFLTGQLFRISKRQRFVFSVAFLILYILLQESLAEGFFWATVSYTYILPQILTTLLIGLLVQYEEAPASPRRTLTLVACAALVFNTIGLCELFVLLVPGLLAAFLGYRLVFERKIDWGLVLLMGIALVSCYLALESPGVKVRQGSNPLGGNLAYSIQAATLATLRYAWQWAPLTFVFSIFLLFWFRNTSADTFRKYFRIRPWVGWLVWIGLTPVLYFPYFYGVGIDGVPVRITNSVNFFFLVGFFYNLLVSLLWLREKKGIRLDQGKALILVTGLALLSLPVLVFRNSNFRLMVSDLKNGTAREYDRELTQRYADIRASKSDTVFVKPLKHIPLSLFVEDIRENPAFLWNKCEATYFGKKAIIIQP
ncbi:MAG: hypothetical protein J7576_10165 [Siphonobacter aquaeclarae]|nr:hypothetical protein [Siphonobacter aquaeclarae]